jgi:hypothetical protein
MNNMRICHYRTNTAELAQEFADLRPAAKNIFCVPTSGNQRVLRNIAMTQVKKQRAFFCIDQEIRIKRNTTYSKA